MKRCIDIFPLPFFFFDLFTFGNSWASFISYSSPHIPPCYLFSFSFGCFLFDTRPFFFFTHNEPAARESKNAQQNGAPVDGMDWSDGCLSFSFGPDFLFLRISYFLVPS